MRWRIFDALGKEVCNSSRVQPGRTGTRLRINNLKDTAAFTFQCRLVLAFTEWLRYHIDGRNLRSSRSEMGRISKIWAEQYEYIMPNEGARI